MSGKQQNQPSNLVPDGSNILTQDDKCGLYESSRTDSGFLSGGNLLVSGEIVSEEIPRESGVAEEDKRKDDYMHIDSGVVCLSETFSSLSLKHPGLNDLDSRELKSAVIKPEDQPWELYFEQDEDGDTQLHNAIVHGFADVALALIRMAPHPRLLDTPNDDAQSPLHLAVASRQSKIARWLIVAGAKPSPRNLHGDSPLHVAAASGDVTSCSAILNPVQHQERTELVLSYQPQPYQECNVDQWNYDGQTCVHVAAIHGHVDVLRRLVWYGADVNARDGKSGYTALHYAVQRGDEKLAYFLLSECKKLNPDTVTYGGRSALQLGYAVPSTLCTALMARGVPSPYSSDEEVDESSEDEMLYENVNIFLPNLVNASA